MVQHHIAHNTHAENERSKVFQKFEQLQVNDIYPSLTTLGIPKFEWVSNSPDFNPIERIWTILKRRIQRRRASERVTTVSEMKAALVEEWEKITVDEINREIDKLPIIMRCLSVNGGNNYHA